MHDIELRVPADARYVGLARLVVTTAARLAGMADERIEDLKIAVSEATANAVQTNRGEGTEQIALRFGPTGRDQFGVTIVDSGWTGSAGREADGERALGLTLIRGLVDVVDFETPQRGASVHMRFAVGMTPAQQRANES